MTALLTKLKMMLTGSWKSKYRKPPTSVSIGNYAVIKLKKFDNFPVVIMVDKHNGGISISYNDSQYDEPTKIAIHQEVQTIISNEFERIENGDL